MAEVPTSRILRVIVYKAEHVELGGARRPAWRDHAAAAASAGLCNVYRPLT